MRIEDLKVGNNVAYFPRPTYWGTAPLANIGTVEKVTKTQIVIDGIHFLKSGHKVGDAYGMHIAIATADGHLDSFGTGELWTLEQARTHNAYAKEKMQIRDKILSRIHDIKNITEWLDARTPHELDTLLGILERKYYEP